GLAALLARRRRRGGEHRLVLTLHNGEPRYLPASAVALPRGSARALGPVIDLGDDSVRLGPPPFSDEQLQRPTEPTYDAGVSVRVLGPLEVRGLVGEVSSQPVMRCLLYLALNWGRRV